MKIILSVLFLGLFSSSLFAEEQSHSKHVEHKGEHTHKHGSAECTHSKTVHGDHTDYDHDGHKHHEKDGKIHECEKK
jgi:hypothetical protein